MSGDVYSRLADEFGRVQRWGTPGELAKAVDPTTVQTPALQLIDDALVDVDVGRCTRLILNLAVQEGKSTRVSHYGVLWFLLRDPRRRIALLSYADKFAADMSYAVRSDLQTFTGDEGSLDLGFRVRQDSKAANRWSLTGHRGGVFAVGLGGSLTGRPVDLMVIDDLVKDARAADSEVQSETAWSWWQTSARTRLAPGAPVVVIMTRWSETDLAGRLIAQQAEHERAGTEHFDRWRVINIPAQADHRPERGEVDPLGREPGEFMVSARGRTQAEWAATKAATSARSWAAMYQGRPSPDEGELFLRVHWQRFELAGRVERLEGGVASCPGADEVVLSLDAAFKDTKTSDFVVAQVWARYGREVYLVDQLRDRMSFTRTLEAVRTLSARWPQARAKYVEDKANGSAIIDELKATIDGLIPINPGRDSKLARARAVSPFVEAGQVFIPSERSAAWADAFIDEAAAFPNGRHDDQVDAMTQALQRLLGKGHADHRTSVASPADLSLMGRVPTTFLTRLPNAPARPASLPFIIR